MIENLKAFLDSKVAQYNRPDFIKNDPVSIPHLFTKKQDIEIMGFWAATLAWGQRVTIINKCKELISLMDGAPYDFIMNHEEPDLKNCCILSTALLMISIRCILSRFSGIIIHNMIHWRMRLCPPDSY